MGTPEREGCSQINSILIILLEDEMCSDFNESVVTM